MYFIYLFKCVKRIKLTSKRQIERKLSDYFKNKKKTLFIFLPLNYLYNSKCLNIYTYILFKSKFKI